MEVALPPVTQPGKLNRVFGPALCVCLALLSELDSGHFKKRAVNVLFCAFLSIEEKRCLLCETLACHTTLHPDVVSWVHFMWSRRILVSSTRKPISYLNLSKRFLQEHGELQLSALGIAIAPMVTLAEILKGRGLAVEKNLLTSLETLSDDSRWAPVSTQDHACPLRAQIHILLRCRSRQKSKLEITLSKSADFDQIIEEEEDERVRATATLKGRSGQGSLSHEQT